MQWLLIPGLLLAPFKTSCSWKIPWAYKFKNSQTLDDNEAMIIISNSLSLSLLPFSNKVLKS